MCIRDSSLREIVSFNLVGDGQLAQLGGQTPMPADHPTQQPRVTEVIQALSLIHIYSKRYCIRSGCHSSRALANGSVTAIRTQGPMKAS